MTESSGPRVAVFAPSLVAHLAPEARVERVDGADGKADDEPEG